MNNDQLTQLKKLAEAATPGPWAAFTDDSGSRPHTNIVAVVPRTDCVFSLPGHSKREANVEYVAAANPSAILSMIERIAELEKAQNFADHIINGVFEGGDFDGGELQDLAVQYGLLKPVEMPAPCREEGCNCAGYGADFPTICFRKTYALASSQGEQKGGV